MADIKLFGTELLEGMALLEVRSDDDGNATVLMLDDIKAFEGLMFPSIKDARMMFLY